MAEVERTVKIHSGGVGYIDGLLEENPEMSFDFAYETLAQIGAGVLTLLETDNIREASRIISLAVIAQAQEGMKVEVIRGFILPE